MFMSGFIFISIYNWLSNKTMDTYLIGIWSLIINALIQLFYSTLHIIFFSNIDFNESFKLSVYVMTAIIAPEFIVKIINSNYIRKLSIFLNNATVKQDIFDDAIDYNKKTLMNIYLKDSDIYYAGTFKLRERKSIESYIMLNDDIVCTNDDECICDYSNQGLNSSVLINLQDIERIELLYEKDSKTWEWLNNQ